MIKFVIGLFLLVLFWLFITSLIKDRKKNKSVEEANDRLHEIKNENKVLDINEKVEEAEAKLQQRKDEKS